MKIESAPKNKTEATLSKEPTPAVKEPVEEKKAHKKKSKKDADSKGEYKEFYDEEAGSDGESEQSEWEIIIII